MILDNISMFGSLCFSEHCGILAPLISLVFSFFLFRKATRKIEFYGLAH
ncbi:hypothetical protein MKHDV_02060 [Halodesulfovibrio sp. MK-HDV]|nr:hypothetical protein MKHDV_02060 [Halodesulfovibrio sp. MK-HDV]